MKTLVALLAVFCASAIVRAGGDTPDKAIVPPNIIVILADDLGYGDVSCYGATKVKTPHIDKLAEQSIRFTDAHSASATCTPSRYALLTGEYAWRKKGTGILTGDAPLIIAPGRTTLPAMLSKAGYATGAVGKWHLGLGTGGLDWNGDIKPGPLEIGFSYCFIMPATGDRVPCVYVENHRVVGLDPSDPIQVKYGQPIGNEPTGKEHPELLKVHPSFGHDMTIVNGISRIGYMSGGKAARWTDEDMADTLTSKAIAFINEHRKQPFFLYFATHDIHVPRVPHSRFAGRSGLGPRGDVILQFDWCVGRIVKTLEELHLTNNTLLIVTSDNGPVVDDGYKDDAVAKLDGHKPAGPWRGGKYSIFEGGTRVPMLACWPARIKAGVSDALVCQVDFLSSFAALTDQKFSQVDSPDSMNVLPALLGESSRGRSELIEHAGSLGLRKDGWKYIEPGSAPKSNLAQVELGNSPSDQLYNLEADPSERSNNAQEQSGKLSDMRTRLEHIRKEPQSRSSQ